MPLVALLFALFLPRVVILFIALTTRWFDGMFQNFFWPVLGFIFAPLSLLWYSAVMRYFDGQWTAIPMAGMVVAVLLDLSQSRWGHRRRTLVEEY